MSYLGYQLDKRHLCVRVFVCPRVYVNSGGNTWCWKNSKISTLPSVPVSDTSRVRERESYFAASTGSEILLWSVLARWHLFFRGSCDAFCQALFCLSNLLPKWVSGALIDWFNRKLTLTNNTSSELLWLGGYFATLLFLSLSFSPGTSFSICLLVNWQWEVHFFHSLRMTGWVIQLASHTQRDTHIDEESDWEGEKERKKEEREGEMRIMTTYLFMLLLLGPSPHK